MSYAVKKIQVFRVFIPYMCGAATHPNSFRSFAAGVLTFPSRRKKLRLFHRTHFMLGMTHVDFSDCDVNYTPDHDQSIKGVPCITEVVLGERERKGHSGTNPA